MKRQLSSDFVIFLTTSWPALGSIAPVGHVQQSYQGLVIGIFACLQKRLQETSTSMSPCVIRTKVEGADANT